jgi:flagellar hook-length control protein FliK
MINLISTLASAPVPGAGKSTPGADPASDSSKGAAAAPASSSAADPAASGLPGAPGGFQSLLDAQNEGSPAQILDSMVTELPAQLVADGLTPPGQSLRGQKPAAKQDTATPVAATPVPPVPGTDMAALIGASAAAGQAAMYKGSDTAVATEPSQAQTAGSALAAAGKTLSTDTDPAAGSAAQSLAAAGTTSHRAETGPAAAADAAATATAVDTAALANAQKSLRDAAAAVTQAHIGGESPGVSAQNLALPQLTASTRTAAQVQLAAAASIDTPIGAQGWDQALGQRVVWMVAQRNPTAEIHVNPPDLGPLSVTVNVNNNTASATFVAAHAATREAITDAMPRLKDMLAESGISLGQVTVSAESFSQGGSGAGQANFTARDSGTGSIGQASAAAATLVSPVTSARTAQGLVDTFA